MKALQIFLLIVCVSAIGFAQNGINYKALIKDANGNVAANQGIDIQFSINIEGATVYRESQQIMTDSNGIAIASIGLGTVLIGDFDSILWKNGNTFLNVQIDFGDGFIDFGTTEFHVVPYAIHALNTEGLEPIDEGNGIGWRLTGTEPDNYGVIGEGAVDVSFQPSISSDRGATGTGSFATGILTHASGDLSSASGYTTQAQAYCSTVIGRHNIGAGNSTSWITTDPLFEIGIGLNNSNRNNALTVLKNGNVGIGIHTPDEKLHIDNGRLKIGTETIEDGGNNALRFNARLLPDINDQMSLGSSSLRWTTVYATNGSINTSDRREKKNIESLHYGLNEILQMQPVSFNWKNKNNQDLKLGLIAQDLLKLVPEVVKTHEWKATSDEENAPQEKVALDRFGVYYSDLIPVLINAIKEQQKIIESEKFINKKQTQQLQALVSRIEILESNSSN